MVPVLDRKADYLGGVLFVLIVFSPWLSRFVALEYRVEIAIRARRQEVVVVSEQISSLRAQPSWWKQLFGQIGVEKRKSAVFMNQIEALDETFAGIDRLSSAQSS